MPQPSNFTRDFRADLAGGLQHVPLTYADPEEAARRFAVYRNNVAHSLSEALARRFPAVQRLVGETFFKAMAKEFISAHPPRSPVLQEWGGEMPGFLEGFPPVASLPYLADVARVEWARGCAYHAADARAIAAETLIDRRVLRLHPSVQMLRLAYPGVSIWQANQPGRDGKVQAKGPETALIWRRADFTVQAQRICEDDARMIQFLLGQAPLADLPPDLDPTAMLTLLLREGLICEEEVL